MAAALVYSSDDVRETVPTEFGGEYRPNKDTQISLGQIIHMIITAAAFLGPTVYYGGQLTARLDSATTALHSLEVRIGDAEKSQNQANTSIALLQEELKLIRDDIQKSNSGHR